MSDQAVSVKYPGTPPTTTNMILADRLRTEDNKMKLYKFKTMTYGKHSIKYVAGIQWNSINVDIKIQTM